MKNVYRATRGDQKALFRDAKPGTRLYVINDHAPITDGRHPGVDAGLGRSYSEWIVTTEKTFITGHPMVQSPSGGPLHRLETLLGHEREIHTTRPNLPNLGARESHSAYTEHAQRASKAVADRFNEEQAAATSRKWSLAGRR
jgi:hypothetical protein